MKKILVCVDGSPREAGVLKAAIALGRKTSAKLVLFRSVGLPRELPEAAFTVSPDEIPAMLERIARQALTELEAGVPAEVRGGCQVLVGTPAQAILVAAQEYDCDLIVIGSHGYEGVDRVLGTTAAKVVNHADRAVLVVRAPDRLV